MATYTKYNTFVENFSNKVFDWFGTNDTFRAVIHTDAPDTANDNQLSNLTQISGNNGYTTGGEDIQNDSTRTTTTVTMTAVDVIWTASGGNLGSSTTGRYISIDDDTATNDELQCSYDYGSTFTIAIGETLTLDFGASLATLI